MFIIILFWLGCDRPLGLLFFYPCFASLYTCVSLIIFFCLFVLFHPCCSHMQVFRKILVNEFHISYSHTAWYLFFFWQCNCNCTFCVFSKIVEILCTSQCCSHEAYFITLHHKLCFSLTLLFTFMCHIRNNVINIILL